jgi:hypothetical protein
MKAKAKTKRKIAKRKATPRRRPSKALTGPVVDAVAIAVEIPAMQMLRMLTTKLDAMEQKLDAAVVVYPSTMIDSAKALTIVQACNVLSGMDDKKLYRRPHLINRVGGNCYVDADEIRAEFPDDFNQARYLAIVERNKPRAGHKAYVPEPESPLLTHLSGNDKRG